MLSIVLAAFSEEIFWAGILSIRKGQWEAARSTGLDYAQTLIYVVIPQAVRMPVAPITNRTIAITKNIGVTILEMEERVMSRVVSPEVSLFFLQKHHGPFFLGFSLI